MDNDYIYQWGQQYIQQPDCNDVTILAVPNNQQPCYKSPPPKQQVRSLPL